VGGRHARRARLRLAPPRLALVRRHRRDGGQPGRAPVRHRLFLLRLALRLDAQLRLQQPLLLGGLLDGVLGQRRVAGGAAAAAAGRASGGLVRRRAPLAAAATCVAGLLVAGLRSRVRGGRRGGRHCEERRLAAQVDGQRRCRTCASALRPGVGAKAALSSH